MALADEDIQFIKDHLAEWLTEQSLGKPPAVYEIELRERMVRVEGDLQRQREQIDGLSAQMDRRFEEQQQRFEQRFDRLEQRFEQVDKRFDQVEVRIAQVDKRLDQVDMRIEQVDRRIEQVDRRIDQVDRRLDAQTSRMDKIMVWAFATIMGAAGLTVAAIKLFPP
jgi:chromosome segregation ATPase